MSIGKRILWEKECQWHTSKTNLHAVLLVRMDIIAASYSLREQDTTPTAQSYADGFLSGPSA
jgi:hypothetical protein